jgi:hypothetical protein
VLLLPVIGRLPDTVNLRGTIRGMGNFLGIPTRLPRGTDRVRVTHNRLRLGTDLLLGTTVNILGICQLSGTTSTTMVAIRGDTMTIRGDTMAILGDTMAIRGDTTAIRGGILQQSSLRRIQHDALRAESFRAWQFPLQCPTSASGRVSHCSAPSSSTGDPATAARA